MAEIQRGTTARAWVVVMAIASAAHLHCSRPGVTGSICGDGQIEDVETCDDGNVADSDGCSRACVIEPAFSCVGEPSICRRPCTADGDCGDDNACTDGRCGEDGMCVLANNEAICDDGLFCNGLDRCMEGACSNHAGDPCASGVECANVCDDVADSCDVAAGTACGTASNPCAVTACDGNGACVGSPVNDGTNCGGQSTVCCSGQCITVSSASNCGACGVSCASGSCISVASSGVYACGCETSSCPTGQGCMAQAGPDLCQCSTCSGAGVCKSVVGSGGALACYY